MNKTSSLPSRLSRYGKWLEVNNRVISIKEKPVKKESQNAFFFIYFIFKLYIIALVLPNIKMNPPQVYIRNFFIL